MGCPANQEFGVRARIWHDDGWRELPLYIQVLVSGQANLLEMIGALGAGRSRPDLLHRWEEKCNKHPDDRDHYQQLDEG